MSEPHRKPNGGADYDQLRKSIQSKGIEGTIIVGPAEFASGASMSSYQMGAYIFGRNAANSNWDVAVINGETNEIFRGKDVPPAASWGGDLIPWTVASSLDASITRHKEYVSKIRTDARMGRTLTKVNSEY